MPKSRGRKKNRHSSGQGVAAGARPDSKPSPAAAKPHPIRYLFKKFWRRRDPKGWIEFAGVIAALTMGGIAGWFTLVEDHLINPKALVVAAAFVAAYKTIETIVDAFGEENNEFDEALSHVFKAVSGWSILVGTGYALIQTLRDDDLWFAISLIVMCLTFALWGAYRAEKTQPSTSTQSGPAA